MLYAITNFEFLKRKYEKDLDANKHAASRKKCFMRGFKGLEQYSDLNTKLQVFDFKNPNSFQLLYILPFILTILTEIKLTPKKILKQLIFNIKIEINKLY
jgi:hypothetical protein